MLMHGHRLRLQAQRALSNVYTWFSLFIAKLTGRIRVRGHEATDIHGAAVFVT